MRLKKTDKSFVLKNETTLGDLEDKLKNGFSKDGFESVNFIAPDGVEISK